MTLQQLHNAGFDLSTEVERGQYRVRCSRCEALVINGTACHETGCPNVRRACGDDSDFEEDEREELSAFEDARED